MCEKMNKLISIIMPVKNGEKYLQEALDGILGQSMNMEIILVNDGSTDRTEEIAINAGCHVLRHETCKGCVAAKNTGLKTAKGDYIMFYDGDDVMREGALLRMYTALEEDPEASAVMAMLQDFVSPDLPQEEASRCAARPQPYYGLFTGAILMRKEIFDIIGPFSEDLRAGDVISWKLQLDRHQLTLKRLPFISTDRRLHSSNFGRTDRKTEFTDYASILRSRLRKS